MNVSLLQKRRKEALCGGAVLIALCLLPQQSNARQGGSSRDVAGQSAGASVGGSSRNGGSGLGVGVSLGGSDGINAGVGASVGGSNGNNGGGAIGQPNTPGRPSTPSQPDISQPVTGRPGTGIVTNPVPDPSRNPVSPTRVAAEWSSMSDREKQQLRKSCTGVLASPAAYEADLIALCQFVNRVSSR